MDEADFLTSVHGHVKAMTADGELGMAGYMWKQTDDGLHVFAIDLEPPQAWLLFLAEAMKENARRIAFCLDRYGKPHQGTLLGDLVAGMYIDCDRDGDEANPIPRPFIIEYCAKPAPRALWFNWQNEFWNAALRMEMLGAIKSLRAGETDPEFRNVSVDADGRMRPMVRK